MKCSWPDRNRMRNGEVDLPVGYGVKPTAGVTLNQLDTAHREF
jgi:hypothetical protein